MTLWPSRLQVWGWVAGAAGAQEASWLIRCLFP